MSRIRVFLSGFNDHELAFFAKYKLKTYMPESQEEVNAYLSERSILGVRINELISENPKPELADNEQRCTRCYSNKLRKTRVAWAGTAILPDYEKEKEDADGPQETAAFEIEIVCDVCGLKNEDPDKPKKQSVGKKIRKYVQSVFDGILDGL